MGEKETETDRETVREADGLTDQKSRRGGWTAIQRQGQIKEESKYIQRSKQKTVMRCAIKGD